MAVRATRADEELFAVLARVHPSPAEVASLWPAEQRAQIVVVIRVAEDGTPSIGARLREHVAAGDPELSRRLRRIHGDVPVAFDFGPRVVVVPLRSVTRA